jgi:tetratricopeptide (TPR) repeat protein
LKIHEESAIPNDPELAVIYNNMGTTYHRMKNYSSAITFYQNSLDIESKSLGSNHPNLAYTHNNIACAFEGLYEYQKAFNHIQRAINIATDTMEAHDSRRRMFHDHLDTFLLKILHLLYRLNKQVS